MTKEQELAAKGPAFVFTLSLNDKKIVCSKGLNSFCPYQMLQHLSFQYPQGQRVQRRTFIYKRIDITLFIFKTLLVRLTIIIHDCPAGNSWPQQGVLCQLCNNWLFLYHVFLYEDSPFSFFKSPRKPLLQLFTWTHTQKWTGISFRFCSVSQQK